MTSTPSGAAVSALQPLPLTWTKVALSGECSAEYLVIIVDASILANALADDEEAGGTARGVLRAAGEFAAPDLVDVETVSVLRKRWLRGTLTEQRFVAAINHLQQLSFARVPTLRLVPRAFELRANVSSYDACYVALAERLGCELVTADGRLAAATGPLCPIRVLR
nr:type II toxin-antitoxin system VapC family toxin [Garicola koreensis]